MSFFDRKLIYSREWQQAAVTLWPEDLTSQGQPQGQHIYLLPAITAKEIRTKSCNELLFLYRKWTREVVMGSKVSSKMAAPAARVIQAVRPHAPLIKFPNRHDMARPNVQEALKTLAVDLPLHNNPAPPPLSRPHVPLTPISGTPDTLASIQLLPARYRRRPMAAEEMEFIQRGGPEWHEATHSLQPKSLPVGDQCVSLTLFLSTRQPNATWDMM